MQNAKTKVVTDFLQNSVFFFNSLFHDQVQLWSLPTSLSASSNFHVKIYPPNSCTLFLRCIQYSLLSLVWMYFSKALIANFTQSPMNFKLPLSFLGTYDQYTSEFEWSRPYHHFNYSKGCVPQILLGPLLNILPDML